MLEAFTLAVAALLWFLGCFLCLSVAESRGLGQVRWFVTAFFCSPLLALIALAATPAKVRESAAPSAAPSTRPAPTAPPITSTASARD